MLLPIIMREFIAIDIPDEIKEKIVEVQRELLKQELFEGKITEEENLHLTLKFLGEIDGKTEKEVRENLKKVKLGKFKAKLGRVGVFSESFIRIIWIELDNCGEIQKEVDEKLSGLFACENRFMSHLTIARVKSVKDREKLMSELGKIKISGEFPVSEFSLKKSDLTGGHPVYSEVEKYNLKR